MLIYNYDMPKLNIPKSHPRYLSLYYRELLNEGVERGITSLQGLTSHGRGEAFDYLIGEKTQEFAKTAIRASAALLVLARHPVISVNGNTAALVTKDLINLAAVLQAPLEVNIFHTGKARERKIRDYLRQYGAKQVLLPDSESKISGIESNRRMISKEGQKKADVILVPLEDGDRTEALVTMGKKVITIDLNPLSRTARKADITIVDNIVRCLPLLIQQIELLKGKPAPELERLLRDYQNKKILAQARKTINETLTVFAKTPFSF